MESSNFASSAELTPPAPATPRCSCNALTRRRRCITAAIFPGDGTSAVEKQSVALMSTVKPVVLNVMIVVATAVALSLEPSGNLPFQKWIVYSAPSTAAVASGAVAPDGLGWRVLGAALNVTFIMTISVAMTYLFVVFFRYRQEWVLSIILILGFIFFQGGFAFVLVVALHKKVLGLALDSITCALLIWNFTLGGSLSMFWRSAFHEHGDVVRTKKWCENGYLILMTAAIAWPFLCFTELTVWSILLVLVVWDTLAVLIPCGPLRYVMLAEFARMRRAEKWTMPPGIIYEANRFRLGLGDFIFYGVVAGRAAMHGYVPAVATICALLFGVAVTVVATLQSTKVSLPALPIALVLACSAYTLARFAAVDYVREMATNAVLI